MITIISTFIADPMQNALLFMLKQFTAIECQFHYHQVFQQLLLTDSALHKNQQGLNVLLIRVADLMPNNDETDITFKETITDFIQSIQTATQTAAVPMLIIITPSNPTSDEQRLHFAEAEKKIQCALHQLSRLQCLTIDDIHALFPLTFIHNQFTDQAAHIPYTLEFYTALSSIITRKFYNLKAKPYKVIAIDCDGVLWKGMAEEDGIENIQISERENYLQHFLLQQYQQGMLLCLCSKNTESSVLAVFQHKKDMLLDLNKHIISHRINWQEKNLNLQSLAQELNVDIETFIFLDDSPVECTKMRAALPQVLTLQIPTDIQALKTLLQHCWAFDHLFSTDIDLHRTLHYQQNKLRSLPETTISFSEFINHLELKLTIREATLEELERVIHLSKRANQFNINPHASSEIDIVKNIKQQEGCLVVSARDKFGDYGLIGVSCYALHADSMQITAFMLSCRALEKGIEFELLNALNTIANQKESKQLNIVFSVSEKNEPALNFLRVISKLKKLPSNGHLSLTVSPIKYQPSLITKSNKKHSTTKINTNSVQRNEFLLNIATKWHSVDSILSALENKIGLSDEACDTPQGMLLRIFKRHQIVVSNFAESLLTYGMDSLSAVLISADIYQHFKVDISYLELIKPALTLANLVSLIESTPRISAPISQSLKTANTAFLPLSIPQQRLWLDEQMEPHTAKNNMSIALEISGCVELAVLQQCFDTLLARHDSLRFSFFNNIGEGYIKIQPLTQLKLTIESYTFSNEALAAKKIFQLSQLPFNLNCPPLIRVALLTIAAKKNILFICIHHIIHDGWSLNIMLQELSSLYHAFSQGLPSPLPSLPFNYHDFIVWQQQHITQDHVEQQKEFWQQQFDKLSPLPLNYDYTDRNITAKNNRITFKISKQVTHRLKALAVRNQSSLYNVLLTAFSILIAQYTNQNDMALITSVSGRHYPQTQQLVGFFVNLLILRITINSDDTFAELLNKNKHLLDTVFLNQDLPYHELIKLISPEIRGQRNSKLTAGFIFQNYQLNPLIINGQAAKRVYADNADLAYDNFKGCRLGNLICLAQEYQQEINLLIEYNADLFKPSTIHTMMQAFKVLLSHIADEAQHPALHIPLVSLATKNKLLYQFNQFNLPRLNQCSNLITEFTTIAARYPQHIAVKCSQHTLSYLSLNQLTDKLAQHLQQQGVSFEIPVAIGMPQSSLWIVAMLAILKAGGCYVPIDLAYPAAHITQLMEDARITFIIHDNNFADEALRLSTAMKLIDINLALKVSLNHSLIETTQSAQQLACIMYTSGSTGKPKGTMINHQNILRLIKSTNYITIQATDRIAQAANLAFDGATFEIWGALLNGASLMMTPKEVLLSTATFADFLNHECITILFLTTQLFHLHALAEPTLFKRLNYLLVGGESILPEVVQRIIETGKLKHLTHVYGPTENTTFSTAFPIKQVNSRQDFLPIGFPIAYTQAYIFDDTPQLNLKPINAPGSLFVGGLGVARGYINNEPLTRAKFIDNPYCPGDILYDTGDIASWLPDGTLKFLGRRDNQIKLNGYRIDLNEIEIHLNNHPSIVQAVVLQKNETSQTKTLTAYIQLPPEIHLTDINVIDYLKIYLPIYKIPKLFYEIDSFPLSQNGKIDKAALLQLSTHPHYNYNQAQELPVNSIQETLITLYHDILNYPSNTLGINDNFFEIGGDSLTAIRLINTIYLKFVVNISFSTLYYSPTVKLLAEKISQLLVINVTSPVFTQHSLTQFTQQTLKTIKIGKDTNTPLVFIHPIGGTGFCYLELIKSLPATQPCYIIQDPSIDADRILFEDIADMAAYYNQIILRRFPQHNAIILAGFSFGSMLCMEMVRQLELNRQADNIKCLVSFDYWVMADVDHDIKETIKTQMLHQYDKVMKTLLQEKIFPKSWMELNFSRLQHLGFSYQPGVINKKIILFKAQHLSPEFSAMQDATNYLARYTHKTVEVYPVQGNHATILQYPYVKQMVEPLSLLCDQGRQLSRYNYSNEETYGLFTNNRSTAL